MGDIIGKVSDYFGAFSALMLWSSKQIKIMLH